MAFYAVFWLFIIIRTTTGVLLDYPTDRNATFGETVILSCETNLELPVYWYFNNHEIFYGGKVSLSFQDMFKVSTNGTGVYNLVISSADESYIGEYICGDDEGQGERRSARLHVTGQTPNAETSTAASSDTADPAWIIAVTASLVGFAVLITAIVVGVLCYKKRTKRSVGNHREANVSNSSCEKQVSVKERVRFIEEQQNNQVAGNNQCIKKNKARNQKSLASKAPNIEKKPLLWPTQKGKDQTAVHVESSTSPIYKDGDRAMDFTPDDIPPTDTGNNAPHETPSTVSQTGDQGRAMDSNQDGDATLDSTCVTSSEDGTKEDAPYTAQSTDFRLTDGDSGLDSTAAGSSTCGKGQNSSSTEYQHTVGDPGDTGQNTSSTKYKPTNRDPGVSLANTGFPVGGKEEYARSPTASIVSKSAQKTSEAVSPSNEDN